MKSAVWICLLALLLSGFSLSAQDISASIGGTILDQSDSAVPNAKVTLTHVERNQVIRTLTTDTSGTYSAPLIPPGTYNLRVEAAGFKTEERKNVVLNTSD